MKASSAWSATTPMAALAFRSKLISHLDSLHEGSCPAYLVRSDWCLPTLGVLGAVIGLIAALGNLNDVNKLGHAIEAAFVATILGIFTAYVVYLPMANKLKLLSKAEVSEKRMIIEGILSLQAGDSPTAIEAKLMVFIPQSEREGLKKE